MPIVSVIPARHGRSSAEQAAVEMTHLLGTGGVTDGGFTYRVRTAQSALVQLEYSTNDDMSSSTTSSGVTTQLDDDYTGGEAITGLSANTTYFYRPLINGVPAYTSDYPKTKTFPTEGVDASVKILLSSCQDRARDTGVTGCWIPAAAEAPDVHAQGGDFFYGDETELESIRASYRDEYTGDQQTYITRVMPRAQTWDDHDYGGNNADGGLASKAVAKQVWREYVPSYPLENADNGIWYDFWIANCHVFVLDTRYQRESSRVRYPATGANTFVEAQSGSSGTTVVLPSDASSGNAYPGYYLKAITSSGTYVRRVVSYVGATRTATVDRSIPDLTTGDDIALRRTSMLDKDNLGETGQVEWLIDGLIASTARWKFLFTSVIWNREDTGGTTNDIWCGWDPEQFERTYILQRLEDAGVQNLIVLSGDRHFSAIDDGTNSDYPELTSSGFHRQPLAAICPWSQGSYATAPSYGLIEVDGTEHTVTLTVKRNDGTAAPSVTPLVVEYAA